MLPFYVYVLMDPDNNQVFYCGKGQGTRVEQHLPEVRTRIANGGELTSAKHLKIQEIYDRPQEPTEMVIGRYESEAEAYAVEATLIKWIYGFEQLTNAVQGHGHEYIREKGDFLERPLLDVPAPVRSNDGSFTRNSVAGLDSTGAFELHASIQNRLTAEGFEVRDFSEKSDRPFAPGIAYGWLGFLVRIKHVDFIIGFSKTCKPSIGIANTLFSRTEDAKRQMDAIQSAKGPMFFAHEAKNIPVSGEGRYRDFAQKPKFAKNNLDSMFELLHEFERIG